MLATSRLLQEAHRITDSLLPGGRYLATVLMKHQR